MDKNISLSIPMERSALVAAASMLTTVANGLTVGAEEVTTPKLEEHEHKTVTAHTEAIEVVVDLESAEPEPEAVFAPTETTEAVAPAPTPVASDVVLDSEGLPWDNRIHASSKAFLAKGGGWKKKRGLDPEVLAKVEAELRLAMSNPETVIPEAMAEAVIPAPAQTAATTPTETAPPPPPPATAGEAITTFPALMAAITAAGLDQTIVKGACDAVGVTALPLLAARPDMIPAVAERLGL